LSEYETKSIFKEKYMNQTSKLITAALAIAVLGGIAYSQLPMRDMDHSQMGMDHSMMTAAANATESTTAFETAMSSMMKGMMAPLTGKPDLDFAQGMIPHHQGAIDMARIVLKYGQDTEVKALAEAVVKAQEGEIAFMKDWLAKADQAALPASPDSIKGNEQAMAAMMKNMMVPYTGDADVDFIKGMIPHHQGAIDMANVAQQFGKDPAMLKLANDVITAQQGEIALMKGWLAKMGR
jgi:uncharacterized protein (DUF305 family)